MDPHTVVHIAKRVGGGLFIIGALFFVLSVSVFTYSGQGLDHATAVAASLIIAGAGLVVLLVTYVLATFLL